MTSSIGVGGCRDIPGLARIALSSVIAPGTRAPRVDLGLPTRTRGVFAADNLLHGAETADIAALSGRHAARAAIGFLESDEWPELAPLEVVCEAPLRWVSPNAISLRG